MGNATYTVKWYVDNGTLNPFNLNIIGGGVFSYEDFRIYASYRLGLINQIDQSKVDNITTKPKGFYVGLGYEF